MLFVGTAHFQLCRTKLHKAAAFPAGAFAERAAFSADIQPAAIFVFVSFFAFGNDRYQILYFDVDPVGVDVLEKAFFAERTVHFNITEAADDVFSCGISFPQTVCTDIVSFPI